MKVVVTGAAGFIGSQLAERLLGEGHEVVGIDAFVDYYPRETKENNLAPARAHAAFRFVEGRLQEMELEPLLDGAAHVYHLAAQAGVRASWGRDFEVYTDHNVLATQRLLEAAVARGVGKLVYASSSSVYGVREEADVTEDLALKPLTDYSRFKADCEELLEREREPGFVAVTLRPATVCGYSRRQRLDVVVNILTNLGYHRSEISVFGGTQLRPNIHIGDMVGVYLVMLAAPAEKIDGRIFNVGYENHTVMQLAEMVRRQIGEHVKLVVKPTDDMRSYHVSSKKIREELGFVPTHSIDEAIGDLIHAFKAGKLPGSLDDPRYFNIKMMQRVRLS